MKLFKNKKSRKAQPATVTELLYLTEIPLTFGIDDAEETKNANLNFIKAEVVATDGEETIRQHTFSAFIIDDDIREVDRASPRMQGNRNNQRSASTSEIPQLVSDPGGPESSLQDIELPPELSLVDPIIQEAVLAQRQWELHRLRQRLHRNGRFAEEESYSCYSSHRNEDDGEFSGDESRSDRSIEPVGDLSQDGDESHSESGVVRGDADADTGDMYSHDYREFQHVHDDHSEDGYSNDGEGSVAAAVSSDYFAVDDDTDSLEDFQRDDDESSCYTSERDYDSNDEGERNMGEPHEFCETLIQHDEDEEISLVSSYAQGLQVQLDFEFADDSSIFSYDDSYGDSYRYNTDDDSSEIRDLRVPSKEEARELRVLERMVREGAEIPPLAG
eukprot:scaffold7970_cov118-Cylindrotheca_fusiformis.AAC.11